MGTFVPGGGLTGPAKKKKKGTELTPVLAKGTLAASQQAATQTKTSVATGTGVPQWLPKPVGVVGSGQGKRRSTQTAFGEGKNRIVSEKGEFPDEEGATDAGEDKRTQKLINRNIRIAGKKGKLGSSIMHKVTRERDRKTGEQNKSRQLAAEQRQIRRNRAIASKKG